MTALAPAVESFFTDYLIAQRGASPHTIASYRDTLRLLFAYIQEQSGIRPSGLDFNDVDAATVSGFLAMLERERHNTGRTRSQRLAAIHSLFRHAALRHPEHAAVIARVLAIQPRKASGKTIDYLAGDEADALLASPDLTTWTGRRDHLLMLLMITSGPRVSEITALTWADIALGRPGARVLWHGKGRKERISPLQAPAVTGLRLWQRENPAAPGAFVFTARGTARKMSTNAVAERIKIHAATAAAACPGISRQERHPACPAAHFRDAPAMRGSRQPLHRAAARPRVPGIDTSLPARRPRTQAAGARPDRPAAHPPGPLHAPGQAPRLPRKPVKLCRTTRPGHRPDQQQNPREPPTSA